MKFCLFFLSNPNPSSVLPESSTWSRSTVVFVLYRLGLLLERKKKDSASIESSITPDLDTRP